jgi:hypothetical protein
MIFTLSSHGIQLGCVSILKKKIVQKLLLAFTFSFLFFLIPAHIPFSYQINTNPCQQEYLKENMRTEIEKISFTENVSFIEATRFFVRRNSEHIKRGSPITDYIHIVDTLYKTSQGLLPKEHLLCGEISYAMGAILQKFEYKVQFIRLAFVFGGINSPNPIFMDHVALAVLNPETNVYELHDPMYNIHFVLKYDDSRRKLSVEEIYLNENVAKNILTARAGAAALSLPTEETVNINMCNGDCPTMESVFWTQQFFAGAENQTTCEIFFNTSQLGNDHSRIDSFMGWVTRTANHSHCPTFTVRISKPDSQ